MQNGILASIERTLIIPDRITAHHIEDGPVFGSIFAPAHNPVGGMDMVDQVLIGV